MGLFSFFGSKPKLAKKTPTVNEFRLMVCELEDRIVPIGTVSWTPEQTSFIRSGQAEGITAFQPPFGNVSNPVSGAVHVVVTHPTNPDIMWVGGTNGGIWRTNNATAQFVNWIPVFDQQPSLSIGAINLDPTDPTSNTLVAGIGRFSSFGRDGGSEAGAFRSTDGGYTWNKIGGTTLDGRRISAVISRGNVIVVAATNQGVWRSTNAGASFSFVPTTAGSGLPNSVTYELVGDPSNNNVIYAALASTTAANAGIFKSSDAGATWTRVSNATMNGLIGSNTSNIEMAVGRHNNVYAAILNTGRLSGLFRSGDGGATWVQLDSPSTNENGTNVGLNPSPNGKGPGPGSPLEEVAGGQGSIHFSIAADPLNEFVVYAGGDRQPSQLNASGSETGAFPNSLGANNYSGRLFRVDASRPLGSQATSLTHLIGVATNSNSAPHADSRDMAFNAAGELIEGDDGGIYRRSNPRGIGDWFGLHGNLQNTEFHSYVYDTRSNMFFGGTQDVGTPMQASPRDEGYLDRYQGDGGVVQVDVLSNAAQRQSIRYYSFQFFGAFTRAIYDETGTLISSVNPALSIIGAGQTLFQRGGIQFYQEFELNAVNPSRGVIGTGNDIYESSDQFSTLTDLTGTGVTGNVSAMAYGGFSGATPVPDVLYYNSSTSLFLRTAATGAGSALAAWTFGTPIDMVLDADNWQNVFVATGSGVYQSTTAGTSFTNITGTGSTSLTAITGNVRTVSFIASALGDILVAGGNTGVAYSLLSNPSVWFELGSNLPNAPVMDLRYDPQDDLLSAGLLGRGGWSIGNVGRSLWGGVVSGQVYDDLDGDGVKEVGENGLGGRTIYLDENNDGQFNSTSTQFNGSSFAITDNATSSGSINVTGQAGRVKDVNVTLNISHTNASHLDVFLISPNGVRVQLFTDVGGSGDNFTNTVLDDEATNYVEFGTAPFTGSFKPEGLLFDFDGLLPNGTWTLEVRDDTTGTAGTVNSWSINLEMEETNTRTDNAGNYRFEGVLPGNYNLRSIPIPAQTVSGPAGGNHSISVIVGGTNPNLDFGHTGSPSNPTPVAVDDTSSVVEGNQVEINVLGNDTDSIGGLASNTVVIVAGFGPANGVVSVNALTGQITYRPNDGFNGTDTFRYTVRDTIGALSNQATVTVNVTNMVPNVPVSNGVVTLVLNQSEYRPGQTAILNGSFLDSGVLDAHTITINWGDGSANDIFTISVGQRYFTRTRVIADPNGVNNTTLFNANLTVSVIDEGTVAGVGTRTYVIDDPPRVLGVNALTGTQSYELGSRVVVPWLSINGIEFQFTETVTADIADLVVTNLGTNTTITTTFTSVSGTLKRWSFTAGNLTRLRLALDGDGTGTGDTNVGISGELGKFLETGDLLRTFSILSGDANGDGVVNSADMVYVRNNIGQVNAFGDIDGDGDVDNVDINLVRQRLGAQL